MSFPSSLISGLFNLYVRNTLWFHPILHQEKKMKKLVLWWMQLQYC